MHPCFIIFHTDAFERTRTYTHICIYIENQRASPLPRSPPRPHRPPASWGLAPAALTGWSASRGAASRVRVEIRALFLAAEAVLTGREETPIGQVPTLTPQGLLGSRTTSSLAPLDINDCTFSAWCVWAHVLSLLLTNWNKITWNEVDYET